MVSRSLYGHRLQRVLLLHSFFRAIAICFKESFSSSNQPSIRCNPPCTAREINPSHSKSNQPSRQELSAFNTAGGSVVPRHSTSNYPSTSKRNQSSPSKSNHSMHSRYNKPSPSKRILQQAHSANSVVVQPPPALTQPLAKSGDSRRFSITPPSHSRYNQPKDFQGCVDID